MKKKTKIILGIAGGLAAAVGIYFLVTKVILKPKKEEQKPEEKPAEETKAKETPGAGAGKAVPKKKSVKVKSAAPKGSGFAPPKKNRAEASAQVGK
jgi:hypothetical protein